MKYTKKRTYKNVLPHMEAELTAKTQIVQYNSARNRIMRSNSEVERIREENMAQQRRDKEEWQRVRIDDLCGLKEKLKKQRSMGTD